MLNELQIKNIINYIDDIFDTIESYEIGLYESKDVYDLLYEIINVFDEDIPNLSEGIIFRNHSEIRDANLLKAKLIMYLAKNNIEYKRKTYDRKNLELKQFWSSFILWFENELVKKDLLDKAYVGYDGWGNVYLNLDFDYQFKLRRGIDYPESLKNNDGKITDIKMFLELAYRYWIKNDTQSHYKFTVEVNDRFRIFKLPYKMQGGIVLKQGYKTTYVIDKIINYEMFERKIKFSEEMINRNDLMEKKSALDFLIDSLQYLVSIQEGNRDKQYGLLASSVNNNQYSKVYSVIKTELEYLMKVSNDFFDIRHNDYLNSAKQKRESLNDSQFIEYLYNRAYSLLYLLRLKK